MEVCDICSLKKTIEITKIPLHAPKYSVCKDCFVMYNRCGSCRGTVLCAAHEPKTIKSRLQEKSTEAKAEMKRLEERTEYQVLLDLMKKFSESGESHMPLELPKIELQTLTQLVKDGFILKIVGEKLAISWE